MGELHSFHIFFRESCIHRYLCSSAAVTAVKHCTAFDHGREKNAAEISSSNEDGAPTSDAAVTEELAKYNIQYEKLLIGFISGLTSFCKTIHLTNELERTEGLSVSYFNVCSTSNFKIHYFETVTGYKLVCITSPEVPSLELTLNAIYTDLIVKMVISNPLYTIGGMISCPQFKEIVAKTLLANM
ncbi:Trafficking protein particle complex subunit 1 [Babesia sp. Xinjiang]|uniref:Trafficking protein particle complex subunit 1 n=1 Tax=Babesia sp. Xinjiang TaxID=462227 RepID=UPI000A245B18|nr:Trafficking protein particle complex subunit 1 [Babesia sp. Xinjiang]ORM39445.1 Trafficking protein particle complex subunit 1 [Babesia sp. Xinjiang]